MNKESVWVRLYLRKEGLPPAMIGGDSLETVIARLAEMRGEPPIRGFSWDHSLRATFVEMEDLITCIRADERHSVRLLIAGIEKMMPYDITAEQRAECMCGFRIDLLSAEGNLAAGAIVLVEQRHSSVPTGMVRRSLLPTLKRLTALDLSKPGRLTLKTVRDKIAWLAGDGCPDLHDETGAEISNELRRVTGPIHVQGHDRTHVDWF